MNPQPNFSSDQIQRIEPSALESIQRAEFDVQISTAKRYPRKLGIVKQDMLSFATLDQETAESCFYTLPRGGKNIQGPSVRLAEIAVSCYGNLRVGSRVIATVTDGPNPHVVIQSVCHDLERNVAVTMEKRRRITKKKSKDYIDEDDINLAANAGAAIAFRDAVFKVVPLALIKPVYEQAKMVAIGDAKTLVDRRARMVDAFGKMGVSKDMILAKLEKKTLDDVNLGDMETLIGLHTALKDGETTIDEVFTPPKAAAPKFEAPKAAAAAPSGIAEKPQSSPQPAPAPQPQPAPEPAPTPTPPLTSKEFEAQVSANEAKANAEIAAAGLAPEPAAEPKKPKKAAVAEPPGPKETMMAGGVTFDDFTDWMANSGRNVAAKTWTSWETVPEAVWAGLTKDMIGVSKAVVLFGKPAEVAP